MFDAGLRFWANDSGLRPFGSGERMRLIGLSFLWLSALVALNGCGASEGNAPVDDLNEACTAECSHLLKCHDPETPQEELDRCVSGCLASVGGSRSPTWDAGYLDVGRSTLDVGRPLARLVTTYPLSGDETYPQR